MDPAELLHDVLAGPEVQVVGVREDDVGAERANLVGMERLDGALRPDGHERGRADVAVSRADDACARRAVGRLEAEGHSTTIASPNE